MKPLILTAATLSILFSGCSKNSSPANNSATAAAPVTTPNDSNWVAHQTMDAEASAQGTHAVSSPVSQPMLAAWQEGDHARAIYLFIEADWSGRPTFPRSMALNLTEDQFGALIATDHELRSRELSAQLDLIKQIVNAVAQAGRDTAAAGKIDAAEKCFTALKEFGAALQSPDRLQAVQTVGRVSENIGKNELAKIEKKPSQQ